MFTQDQLNTIVENELHSIIFVAGEEGSVFLNEDGHADPETETGDHYNESDASEEFKSSLKREIESMMNQPEFIKAFNDYAEQSNLPAGETIEARFGFDLGAERIAGVGFSEIELNDDTLVAWVESLDTIDLFVTDNNELDSYRSLGS